MLITRKSKRAAAFHKVLAKAYRRSHEEGLSDPRAREMVDGLIEFNQIKGTDDTITLRFEETSGNLTDKQMARALHFIVRELAYETAAAYNLASHDDPDSIQRHAKLNEALRFVEKALKYHRQHHGKATKTVTYVKLRDLFGSDVPEWGSDKLPMVEPDKQPLPPSGNVNLVGAGHSS